MTMQWVIPNSASKIRATRALEKELVHAGCSWTRSDSDNVNDDVLDEDDNPECDETEGKVISISTDTLLEIARKNPPEQRWFDESPQTPPS